MTRERKIRLLPTADRRFDTKVKCPTGRASFWVKFPTKRSLCTSQFQNRPSPRAIPRHSLEFFLALCRLRQGFKEEHLSRITISWVNFMFLKFCIIPVWPSRAKVDQHMTADFKHKYPSTRVIIDCTEIRCQRPKSLRLNSELLGSYKNH